MTNLEILLETTKNEEIAKKNWLGKNIHAVLTNDEVVEGRVINIIASPTPSGYYLPASVSLGCPGLLLDNGKELILSLCKSISIIK